jgi:hypothetical protein
VERRAIAPLTDVLANSAVVPYARWLLDRRGARNAIAWFAEAYLADRGLGYDGRPR